MTEFAERKRTAAELNLKGNPEKEAIIKAIIASGALDVHGDVEDGVVRFCFKEKKSREKLQKLQKLQKQQIATFFELEGLYNKSKIFRMKGKTSVLERVAKSQDIKLANFDSSDAACSGVIL